MDNPSKDQNCIKECDKLWEERGNKATVGDAGTYIDLDDTTVRRIGQDLGDLKAPGFFRSFADNTGRERYFLKGLGSNRFGLFRK